MLWPYAHILYVQYVCKDTTGGAPLRLESHLRDDGDEWKKPKGDIDEGMFEKGGR